MTEKLTEEAIEEMVDKAKGQSARMIDTMLRQVVADFEAADSGEFKLVLTIEGERKDRDAVLTLQTKAQSTVDLKRKDQTQADVIDWGPNLFNQGEGAELPEDGEAQEGPEGIRMLRAAPKLLPAPDDAVDAEFTVEDGQTEDDENGDETPNN